MANIISVSLPLPSETAIANNINSPLIPGDIELAPLVNNTLPNRMYRAAIFNLGSATNSNASRYTVTGTDINGNTVSQANSHISTFNINQNGFAFTVAPFQAISSVVGDLKIGSAFTATGVAVGFMDCIANTQSINQNSNFQLTGAVGNYTYNGSAHQVNVTNNMFVMPDGIGHQLAICGQASAIYTGVTFVVVGWDIHGNSISENITLGTVSANGTVFTLSTHSFYIVSAITVTNAGATHISVGVPDLVASAQSVFFPTLPPTAPLVLNSNPNPYNVWKSYWTPVLLSTANNTGVTFTVKYLAAPDNSEVTQTITGLTANGFAYNPNILTSEIISIKSDYNVVNIRVGVLDYVCPLIVNSTPLTNNTVELFNGVNCLVLFTSPANNSSTILNLTGSHTSVAHGPIAGGYTDSLLTYNLVTGIGVAGAATTLSVGFDNYYLASTTTDFADTVLIPLEYPVILGDFSAQILFTSGNFNNENAIFLVTGTDINGNVLFEAVQGAPPNDVTVTTNSFKTITSIGTTAPFQDLSIGIATIISNWILLDNKCGSFNASVGINIGSNNANYSIFQTLQTIQGTNINNQFINNMNTIEFPLIEDGTASQLISTLQPASAFQLIINSGVGEDPITMNIVQQGL